MEYPYNYPEELKKTHQKILKVRNKYLVMAILGLSISVSSPVTGLFMANKVLGNKYIKTYELYDESKRNKLIYQEYLKNPYLTKDSIQTIEKIIVKEQITINSLDKEIGSPPFAMNMYCSLGIIIGGASSLYYAMTKLVRNANKWYYVKKEYYKNHPEHKK